MRGGFIGVVGLPGICVPLLMIPGPAFGFPAEEVPSTLPRAYDLRTAGPGGSSLVTAVKHQGHLGDCWAFAASSAFESGLLRRGLVRDPLEAAQISTWHMAARAGGDLGVSLKFPYKHWGGGATKAIGYWTRGEGDWVNPDGSPLHLGGGPVWKRENPLNAFPIDALHARQDLNPFIPPARQPLAFLIRQAAIFYQDQLPRAEQVLRLKRAILHFGALDINIHFDHHGSYHKESHTFCYKGDHHTSHDVLIAGWDDDKRVPGVDQPGCWLVQNSWGTRFGDEGYFWISYYDRWAGHHAVGLVPERGQGWNPIPLTTPGSLHFPTQQTGEKQGIVSRAAARLQVPRAARLAAIGIVTRFPDHHVTLQLFRGWDRERNEPTGPLPHLTVHVRQENAGYHLVHLPRHHAVEVSGEIVVVVDYGAAHSQPIPCEKVDRPPQGASFYFHEGRWIDLATANPGGVFFLRGWTRAD